MKKIIKLTERDLSRIVRRVINEDESEARKIGKIIDDILSSFDFSEKGNDELLSLANYILEDPEKVVDSIMMRLKKGYGAHKEGDTFGVYTSKRDELRGIEDRLSSRRKK